MAEFFLVSVVLLLVAAFVVGVAAVCADAVARSGESDDIVRRGQ